MSWFVGCEDSKTLDEHFVVGGIGLWMVTYLVLTLLISWSQWLSLVTIGYH